METIACCFCHVFVVTLRPYSPVLVHYGDRPRTRTVLHCVCFSDLLLQSVSPGAHMKNGPAPNR